MESNDQETHLLNSVFVAINNNNNSSNIKNDVSSSKFARRFFRSKHKVSPQPPNFVSIVILIALFGIIQIYSGEKKDESIAEQMVMGIPCPPAESDENDTTTRNLTSDLTESTLSPCQSPYEQIWVNSKLPNWAKKQPELRQLEKEIPPHERICFVHVGKTGGSSVGRSLGFSLHCSDSSRIADGLLPRRATRIFHADTYDCRDDSAYFMFAVRDPVRRIQSDFLYERPSNERMLRKQFPEYFQNRKEYYLDCPFRTMEDVVRYGLWKNSSAREECKMRAYTALWGTKHFPCHHYFNYQFHFEGLPKNARILVIRNEVSTCHWLMVLY